MTGDTLVNNMLLSVESRGIHSSSCTRVRKKIHKERRRNRDGSQRFTNVIVSVGEAFQNLPNPAGPLTSVTTCTPTSTIASWEGHRQVHSSKVDVISSIVTKNPTADQDCSIEELILFFFRPTWKLSKSCAHDSAPGCSRHCRRCRTVLPVLCCTEGECLLAWLIIITLYFSSLFSLNHQYTVEIIHRPRLQRASRLSLSSSCAR